MSNRLTAESGTVEFLRELLAIAQESDHPIDKALTKVLRDKLGITRIYSGRVFVIEEFKVLDMGMGGPSRALIGSKEEKWIDVVPYGFDKWAEVVWAELTGREDEDGT